MEALRSPDEESPLLQSAPIPTTTTKDNRARDIHILSAAFLLVFLAHNAIQNLESTINTEGNLGTTSLGILYVSFAIFSLISSLVVRNMGAKNALLLGTSGYWLFMAANLMPNWYTMVPASVYLGFAASILWVGQGTYLTSTALAHARDLDLDEGSVIGNFNGEFGGIFACNQVIGNIISLLFLKDEEGGSTSSTTVLFIVFLCTMSMGTILMCFLQKSHSKVEESSDISSFSFSSSVASASKTVIKPFSDKRILLVIPLFAYSGVEKAFVWAEFTKDVVKPALGEAGVAFLMVVYGAFYAVFSLVSGRLTSSVRSVSLIVAGGCSAQAITLLWVLLKYSTTHGVHGVAYPLIMAAALGIGDGVLSTQLSAFLGMLFKDDMEGAFAQFSLWQSGSIAALFFLASYMSLHALSFIMLSLLCVAAVAFWYLTVHVERSFSVLVSSS